MFFKNFNDACLCSLPSPLLMIIELVQQPCPARDHYCASNFRWRDETIAPLLPDLLCSSVCSQISCKHWHVVSETTSLATHPGSCHPPDILQLILQNSAAVIVSLSPVFEDAPDQLSNHNVTLPLTAVFDAARQPTFNTVTKRKTVGVSFRCFSVSKPNRKPACLTLIQVWAFLRL